MSELIDEIREKLLVFNGETCWYVRYGVHPTLLLDFGKAIKLKSILFQEGDVDRFMYDGQYSIGVLCTWRLDDLDNVICSSDCTEEQIAEGVMPLVGETVVSIEIFPPVWDAVITFSSGKKLKIFCDHVQEPRTLNNWDFAVMETTYFFGKGRRMHKEERLALLPDDPIDPESLGLFHPKSNTTEKK